jgi:phosphoserine phosphatase
MTGPGTGQHWVFDVDGTLADAMAATRLRPGAGGLLDRLAGGGATLSLWSAGGAPYASRVADRLDIRDYFAGVAGKAVGAGGRWVLPPGWGDHARVVCVDDEPGRLPTGVEVVAVRPWLGAPSDAVLSGLALRPDDPLRPSTRL